MAAVGGFTSAFWSLQVNINNGIHLSRARKIYSPDANIPPDGQDFGTYTGSFSWGYGSPVSREVILFAHTDAQFSASGAGHALVDLSHTFEWRGATITTTGGQPVPDAVLTSDSGTNWLNAVPEPASVCGLVWIPVFVAGRRGRRNVA
jgi:hypothetical protein